MRTITQIRSIAKRYADKYNYDFIIYDTSPSLGMLNRVILSMADGFIIPCLPDKFSLYGIKNIGNALAKWKVEFDTILSLQGVTRKSLFPGSFVKFLGYTIYNARPYRQEPALNKWDLAQGHYNFAKEIPTVIRSSISEEMLVHLDPSIIDDPIGKTAVMHTHNTLPNLSQKYYAPIWELPDHPNASAKDRSAFRINRAAYDATRPNYIEFARDVISRVDAL